MHPSCRPTTRLAAELLEDRSTPVVFTVTNANDSGPGSLRAAVAQAEADAAPDTIVFAPSVAGATIGLSSIGDSSLGPSALLVATPVTIRGSGQTISRGPGAPGFRLFAVGPTGSLTLAGLTLSGGLAQGGGSGSGGAGVGLGGAVYNQGALQILDCTLTGNQAVGGGTVGAAGAASGGGGLGGAGDAAGNG
ncbi:MAG: hypothetical protein JWO38_7359, partial [Gemmataceae bacterium]|nr:hypothetical protein [Gemmataceae bacterium]